MNTESRRLMTIGRIARRLRVPVRWLREEAASGRIPAIRAGSVFLADAEAVERVLLERANSTQHDGGLSRDNQR